MNKSVYIFLLTIVFLFNAKIEMSQNYALDNSYDGCSIQQTPKDIPLSHKEISVNSDLFGEENEEEEETENTEESNSKTENFAHTYKNFESHSGLQYLWDYNNSQNFYTHIDSASMFEKLYVIKETISFLI